ncbi:hypothetical protein N9189_03990, partial [Pirellulaceae bacterium]|nr:hypothetical protein [Pirellulaceae bacterium]
GKQIQNDNLPENQEVSIYDGDRGENFTNMLRSFLKRGKLKDNVIDRLLAPENMEIWNDTFTHQSANSMNNFKYMRFYGQAIVNSLLTWYYEQRFPQLHCPDGVPIMTRLKINYASNRTFTDIAKKMDLLPFVTSTTNVRNDLMLSHCLEAVFGTTILLLNNEIHNNIGIAIASDILSNLYDIMVNISLNYYDLFDSKTILKQLFDKRKNLGTLKYTHEMRKDDPEDELSYSYVQLFAISNSGSKFLADASSSLKADAEKTVSKIALKYYASIGVAQPIPNDYLMFCDKECPRLSVSI